MGPFQRDSVSMQQGVSACLQLVCGQATSITRSVDRSAAAGMYQKRIDVVAHIRSGGQRQLLLPGTAAKRREAVVGHVIVFDRERATIWPVIVILDDHSRLPR